jgi:hypothetical protein
MAILKKERPQLVARANCKALVRLGPVACEICTFKCAWYRAQLAKRR